jgi:hypothetical protein
MTKVDVEVMIESAWPGAKFGEITVTLGSSEMAGAVGYKRPPKATQFPPGRSGNPSGKPKSTTPKRRSIFDEIEIHLGERDTYMIKGRKRKMSRLEAAAFRFSTKIAGGDPIYLKLLMEYDAKGAFKDLSRSAADFAALLEEDEKIITQYKTKRLKASENNNE